MANFYLKETKKTPEVKLDSANGIFEFTGVSLPEDPETFYGVILQKLEEYFHYTTKKTTCFFKLYYFNSASNKKIYELLEALKCAIDNGHEIEIKWYIFEEDEEMIEEAKEFAEIVEVPISIEYIIV